MADRRAPETLTLRFCPECGATDRWKHLPVERPHMAPDTGKRCAGRVESLTYKLADPSTSTKEAEQ